MEYYKHGGVRQHKTKLSDTIINKRQSIAEAQFLREEIKRGMEASFPCSLPWQEYLNSQLVVNNVVIWKYKT